MKVTDLKKSYTKQTPMTFKVYKVTSKNNNIGIPFFDTSFVMNLKILELPALCTLCTL